MSQSPPISSEVGTPPPGKISGAARFLGALLVVPLFVLTVLTLWVPAFSLVTGSFQHPSDGAADGGHWTNVLGFTVALCRGFLTGVLSDPYRPSGSGR
jgi:hypothetical protein